MPILNFLNHEFASVASHFAHRDATRSLSKNDTTINETDCSRIYPLETTFVSETKGFGSMFNVRSKEAPLKILTLAFSALELTGVPVDVMVYTRLGGYIGHEDAPWAWTLISEATLMTAPIGQGTLIPQASFKSVEMNSNETRAFYITLKTRDLRYSIAKGTVGQVAVQDDHLQIHIGSAMLEYPFSRYLFEPRVFNGIFYYEAQLNCQDLLLTAEVPLPFVIQIDDSFIEAVLISQINNILKASVISIMKTDPKLRQLQKSFALSLVDVNTSIPKSLHVEAVSSCEISSKNGCIVVMTSIRFRHFDTIQPGQVTYQLLNHRQKFINDLNLGNVRATYVGALPMESRTVLTLEGVPEGKHMNQNQVAYFEEVTSAFLAKRLSNTPSANILSVQVTHQKVVSSGRRRLRSSSSLQISTTVTGEYRPPPFVALDGVVSDSIDGGSSLADDLKSKREVPGFLKPGNSEFFANVDAVHTTPPSIVAKQAQLATTSQDKPTFYPYLSLPFVFLGFLVSGYILYKKRSKRKQLLDKQMKALDDFGGWNDHNVLTAEVTPLHIARRD